MMMQIFNIPDIQNFKLLLNTCKEKGLIERWELPYEQLLTRLQAAIFFFEINQEVVPDELYLLLSDYPNLVIRRNEGTMSSMGYRLSFK